MLWSPLRELREDYARLRQIGRVLLKYRWHYLLARLGLDRLVPHRRPREAPRVPTPEDLRRLLQELGPTFIKLGQLLSTRPDLLRADYIRALEQLQDTAPPMPFDIVRRAIEKELECPLEEAFAEFEPEPLAAASIAQVHRARLQSGALVAVKVQRPDAEQLVLTDLRILGVLVRTAERVAEIARLINIRQIVEEFSNALRSELDYFQEARNMQELRRILPEDRFEIPRVHWPQTTSRVLTMSLVRGVKINHFEALRAQGLDPRELARSLFAGALRQVCVGGLFHADLHPGNVWVTPEGRIALLDFGMVGRLDQELRQNLVVLLLSVIDGDPVTYVDAIADITSFPPDFAREPLEREIGKMMSRYRELSPKQLRIGEGIRQAFRLLQRYQVRPPAEIAMMGKLFINLEGVCMQLDPDMDFLGVARPVLYQAVFSRFDPRESRAASLRFLQQSRDLAATSPGLLLRSLRRFAYGSIPVQLEHGRLNRFPAAFEQGANRLAASLVSAALIISSALVALSGAQPRLAGWPVVSVVAAGLGLFLAVLVGIDAFESYLRARHERR